MFKAKFIISSTNFYNFFLIITSYIKNQTRILKKISKLSTKIFLKKKMLTRPNLIFII